MRKHFTAKRILTGFLTLSILGTYLTSLTYSSGAPSSNTNAPGESNCTSCHSGSLQTSGANYNNISFSGNFTGGGYIPDSTYTITLSYSQSGRSKFGFQLTCLTSNNTMAGTLSSTSSATSVSTGSVSGGTRSYMNHTSSGNSGSGSISWTFQWKAPSTNVDSVTFYSIVNSSNNGGSTASDIIIAREFKIGPSSLLPVATASASTANVCQGIAVSLSGSGTNTPTNWDWTLSGGSPNSSTTQNPSVVYNNQGTYNAILRIKNAKGWSAPDTVTIVVKPAPTAFIGGSATRTICPGDSVNLVANFAPGNTYTWNNGMTGNNIWVKDTGDYQVSVANTNGCGRVSNIIKVNHFNRPSASLSSNAFIFNDSSCTGNTLTLEASSSTFDSFFYYAGNTELTRIASPTYNTYFDSTTTYGLIVKDSNGCSSEKSSYTVTAKEELDAPVVSCINQTPSSVTFEWDGTTFHNGYEISTNGGNNWISPSSGAAGTTHVVTGMQPEDSVTILIRAKDNAPCFYSKVGTKTCVSDTCSQLQVDVTYDEAVCYGELINFEINGLADKFFGLSIEGGDQFTDTIFSFSSSVSKTIVLAVTDSANLACPANEILLPLVVDRIFDINLKVDKLSPYCPGETVTLTANDTLEQFNFYLNGNVVQNGASNSYSSSSMENSDSVFVVVTKGECTDTSAVEVIIIESPADATFSYDRTRAEYTFRPTIDSYTSYSWDFGDGSPITTDKNPKHNFATSEGKSVDVTLEVVTNNNCANFYTEQINLPQFSNVEVLDALGLSVYPNPIINELIIANEQGHTGKIAIYSVEGELVTNTDLLGSNTKIAMNNYSAGIYILKISINGKESSIRVYKK
jgi:hypothetical protein